MSEDQSHYDEIELLLLQLQPASVWPAADLDFEPEIQLICWTVKRDRRGNSYFVGTRADDGCGRVSTPIVEFDSDKRSGRTRSGRVYELVGPSGHSSNGEYVWSIYKAANNIKEA